LSSFFVAALLLSAEISSMNSKNASKTCLICNEHLRGRSDKKFCGDFCRNLYHNNRNKATNQEIYRINQVLKKNRAILKQAHHYCSLKTIDLQVLEFDFRHFTHFGPHLNGKNYFFCYEYGYQVDHNQRITIIKSGNDL